MRIKISTIPFLPVLAAAALSLAAVQPAVAQQQHDQGGINLANSAGFLSLGPVNTVTIASLQAAVAQIMRDIESGDITMPTAAELMDLLRDPSSSALQVHAVVQLLTSGYSSGDADGDGDRDALLLSSSPTSDEGATRIRNGAGLGESLRALGNVVAPRQSAIENLVETLQGLLGPSPYPGQLAQAVGFFNMVVDGAPASYLANPPQEFVAIHAILNRMAQSIAAGSN